jgi:signal transduction histidine kinase
VYLRHHIAGPLGNIRKSFNSLRNIIDNQLLKQVDGLMEMKVNLQSKLTFGDYVNIIQRDLESMSLSVSRTSKEVEIIDYNEERINIIKFLDNYIIELQEKVGHKYKILFYDKDWILKEMEYGNVKSINIIGDRELLRKMFDNLFENAVKHGFTNDEEDLEHIFWFDVIWFSEVHGIDRSEHENQGVEIRVVNTCNYRNENFTEETYKRKGGTAGKFAGDGFGGWFVNYVMQKHEGVIVKIEDDYGESFPEDYYATNDSSCFGVTLNFPIKIEYNE